MKIIGIIILMLCVIGTVSGLSGLTVNNTDFNSIEWSWNSGLVTNITIDGIMVCNFDPYTQSFVLSGLAEDEYHTIKVYADNISLSNTAKTETSNLTTVLTDTPFYLLMFMGIVAVVCASVYNRMIGFIGLICGALATMASYSVNSVAVIAGIILAVSSVISIFWGSGD